MRRVRIFHYLPEVDAFVVTDEYREIAQDLGLVEWTPVVWMGRVFCMDNDYGEHWFDNWDARDQREAAASRLGLDAQALLVIDPEKFQDGRDGPCHSSELRGRFWKEVLEGLELSLDLLADEARSFNQRAHAREHLAEDRIPDLEERILRWRARLEVVPDAV